MILSVSRRTDIPSYYADWFFNRLQEGWLCTRNPMNPKQVSRLTLTPETIDVIIFWTKNPEPMLKRLGELKDYPFYVQFTLTGYGTELEPGVPPKREHMFSVFQKLSDAIGADRLIWRYDPILFTSKYTPDYHQKAFLEIAKALEGYTERVVISFLDLYAKTKRNMKDWKLISETALPSFDFFIRELVACARAYQMEMVTCAEQMDLSAYGIKHGSCIDKTWIERLLGYEIQTKKDRNQRTECGCIESVDIGTYHTCRNGCCYCYANYSPERVAVASSRYDPASPILCDQLSDEDTITNRPCYKLPKAKV